MFCFVFSFLKDCVVFYLNVFVEVLFCLMGFWKPESKQMREKELTAFQMAFRPPSHSETFSLLTQHDFGRKGGQLSLGVLEMFKPSRSHEPLFQQGLSINVGALWLMFQQVKHMTPFKAEV